MSNFDDGFPNVTSGLQQFGFAILAIMPVLALTAVALRLYSRYATKQIGWGMPILSIVDSEIPADRLQTTHWYA